MLVKIFIGLIIFLLFPLIQVWIGHWAEIPSVSPKGFLWTQPFIVFYLLRGMAIFVFVMWCLGFKMEKL